MDRTLKRAAGAVLAFTAIAAIAVAQVSREERLGGYAVYVEGVAPASAADALTETVYVDAIVIVNNNSSAVTVTVRDRSTACAGAACPLIPDAISVAAKTIYAVPLFKARARDGINWSASTGTGVVVRIVGIR
jgi:hypothetical protein